MFIDRRWNRLAIAVVTAVASLNCLAIHATDANFVAAVVSTHPLAYYRLDSVGGKSLVGATTYKFVGGVTSNSPGARLGGALTYFASLDGRRGYILTTQAGGVGASASMMAWVNLAELPSKTGRIVYVAGESESGNDLDVQFEADNQLKFYTASGGHLSFAPPAATLPNQWHMIVATLDTQSQTRVIYWDGKPVAQDKGGGQAGKKNVFSLGESTVFTGRFFKGGIQDAALWSRALKATDVAAIYAAAAPAAVSSASVAASANTAAMPTTGPFATKGKVEVEDANGPVKLRREEDIAYMFLSAIEQIEHDCQLTLQHVCTFAQILSGAYPAGTHMEHLKFDPNKTDPNYTYTLAANGMAWEAHANPKKPGLKGFCFMARTIGTTTATYNPAGTAGWTDIELGNRGMEGDSFATQ
jgi:hypothetical protein